MMPPDLPPISNKLLYSYRVFIKWFSFFFFGFASTLLTILILPPMRLVFHPRQRFQKYARRFVSASFRFFVRLISILGLTRIKPGDRELYRKFSSKVIVANHPSLLDVVMLISLIPNADCIVNAYLNHSILRGIVRQLYILSSNDFEDILKSCDDSFKQGNCLLVFPEGTRTPRKGKVIVRKGAARIALASGRNIVPIHIGGTDKYGLGKKDPWTGVNPTDRYVYQISIGEEISIEKYMELSKPAAVRALTKDIYSTLFPGRQS